MAIFDVDKYILENARDINNIEKSLIVFFKHALKWRYQYSDQGRHQTSSWIGSILEHSENTYNILTKGGTDLNTNFMKSGEKFIEKSYYEGKDEAEIETGMNFDNDINEHDSVYKFFDNFINIASLNIIVEWLYEHAKFEKARQRVMTNDTVYNFYTGTKYQSDKIYYNKKRIIEEQKKKNKKK